jgi:hypothetical protein
MRHPKIQFPQAIHFLKLINLGIGCILIPILFAASIIFLVHLPRNLFGTGLMLNSLSVSMNSSVKSIPKFLNSFSSDLTPFPQLTIEVPPAIIVR